MRSKYSTALSLVWTKSLPRSLVNAWLGSMSSDIVINVESWASRLGVKYLLLMSMAAYSPKCESCQGSRAFSGKWRENAECMVTMLSIYCRKLVLSIPVSVTLWRRNFRLLLVGCLYRYYCLFSVYNCLFNYNNHLHGWLVIWWKFLATNNTSETYYKLFLLKWCAICHG
jgi:hypothetical protein